MSTLDRKDFDEFIHEMCKWPIEKIVDTIADDPDLRDYLAACAGNYRNGADYDKFNSDHRDPEQDKDWYHFWETTQFLTNWTWKDYVKFSEEADRKSIAHWAPYILRALDQRIRSQHSQRVKENLERKRKETEDTNQKKALETFIASIPPIHKGACLDDFKDTSWSSVVNSVMNGCSFIAYGGNGIGKSRLGYAIGVWALENGMSVHRDELSRLLQNISSAAMNSRYSAMDIIDMDYIQKCDVLILDEVDKVSQQDTAFRNFSYLIDKRYEYLKQTIIFCNAGSSDELTAKIGNSIRDRFTSKKWKASTINCSKMSSLRSKEATA